MGRAILQLVPELKSCANKLCVAQNPQAVENFSKYKHGHLGLRSQCKTCCSKEYKGWADGKPPALIANRAKANKNRYYLSRFGITLEDYNRMFAEQQGCCAICNKHQSEFKLSLAVDHCHHTGKVRGLLCHSCNCGIGKLKDSIPMLNKALDYLRKY